MATPIWENVAKVAVMTRSDTQNWVNTLWFEHEGSITPEDLNDLAEAIWDWYETEIIGLVSDAVELYSVSARDYTVPNGNIRYETRTAVAGGRSSGLLPSNVTMTVKFESGIASRAGRGRNYVVGLTEDMVSGDDVVSPYATDYVDAYGELIAYVGPLGWSHVIASAAQCNEEPGICQGDVYPVLNYGTDGIVDSQRRRLKGRGS